MSVCPLPLHPSDFETQMERLTLTRQELLIQDCEWLASMHMSPGSRCVVRVSKPMSVYGFVSEGLSVLIAGSSRGT